MPEENIEDYFNMLPDQVKPQTPPTLIIDEDTQMIESNQSIIDQANKLLLERLRYGDDSLRLQDIVSMKTEAFKQNQTLKWFGEDAPDLIPSIINIQIINN